MRRKGVIAIGEYYHVYNRGVDRRRIYLDEKDYNRFLMLLYLCNGTRKVNIELAFRDSTRIADVFKIDRGRQIVAIGAWCLMPNHFHLLCKEIEEGGLQMFMQRVCGGYARYFNIKYERSGALFQGRFQAQHVDSDTYLRYLYSYIYLNPIKLVPGEKRWKEYGILDIRGVSEFLDDYKYSSMPKTRKFRLFDAITSTEHFPSYSHDIQSMERDTLSWLTISPKL